MRFQKIQQLSKLTFVIANVMGNLLLLLMFVFLLMGVVSRYILHQALAWPEETCMILAAWMGFFGASVGLKERAHVGTTAFVSLFPTRVRNCISIVADALAGIFAAYLILYGWQISFSAGTAQTTPYWGISYFYLYFSVCVGGFFLFIQALSLTLEDIFRVFCSQQEAP
jgi:TRAP-type C4-dicarboxylate transport system permease small subunit